VRIASRLKELVAANFVEVRREDEDEVAPAAPVPAPAPVVVEAPPPPPAPAPPPVFGNPTPPVYSSNYPPAATPPGALSPEERFPLPGFARALREDGILDMAVIVGDTPIANVPISAEQAVEVLRSLPDDATPAHRYRAMKEALAGDVDAVAPQVVTDAAQKMVLLNRFLTNAQAENAAFRAVVDGEIARLEEQIGDLRELQARIGARSSATLTAARKRVDHMTGIIAFFDEFQAMYRFEQETGRDAYQESSTSAYPDSDDDSPAFLNDDNVYKLLGVTPTPEKKARAA
jgi:hypothetical protein